MVEAMMQFKSLERAILTTGPRKHPKVIALLPIDVGPYCVNYPPRGGLPEDRIFERVRQRNWA